jgi:GGDEF domain-containing protein
MQEGAPRRRRARPVADAPVDELLLRAEDLAKGWLLALLEQAPLDDAPAILAADLAREGPRVCDAVVRALATDTDLRRLEPGGALERLVGRTGEFAGALGAEATSRAVDALQAVIWSALRAWSPVPDADQISDLAERLARVIELVRAAALRRLVAGEGGGGSQGGRASRAEPQPGPRAEPQPAAGADPGLRVDSGVVASVEAGLRVDSGVVASVEAEPRVDSGVVASVEAEPRVESTSRIEPGPEVESGREPPEGRRVWPPLAVAEPVQRPEPRVSRKRDRERPAGRDSEPGAATEAADALWVGAIEEDIVRSEHSGAPLSVLLVELDEAARIETVERAPEVLATFGRFAQAVRSAVRRQDIMACETEARAWIIARDTTRTGAQALAQRVAEAVREAEPWRGAPLAVSVGVAVLGQDGVDAAGLIDSAEQAKFAAAASGVPVLVRDADRGPGPSIDPPA